MSDSPRRSNRRVTGYSRRGSMNVHDDAETDSLSITLSEPVSAESREVAPGVVVDFDADGHLVGIDIDRGSQVVDLSRVETHALPVQ